ncbi:MAG: hypothetical protein ACQETI_10265 [Halobacteriota archaeon]
MADDLAAQVREVLDVDRAAFDAQVEADAAFVKEALDDGVFDNHQSIVGLEYEFYAVGDGRWVADGDGHGSLMRVPRRLLDLMGFEKELGLHNAEMSTSPQPLNQYGLRAQESEVQARLQSALSCAETEGMQLVSDGMWTIPPAGETAGEYLTDSIETGGVRIATNMSNSVRYHAMANGPEAPDAVVVDAPNVTLRADTVLPESLITSIQPHFQVAHAADLPRYFNYALRIAGPLLALGVNSPFFPPDLYDDVTPETILEDAWDEHRISVFESVLNDPDGDGKVRFPRDLTSPAEAVDRVVDDEMLVPMPVRRGDRFDDQFATLRRKHGTFWRWVRPVFDGATRSEANARIEFRPIAAQPTVRDSVAFQAAFAGLMESLPRREHPCSTLSWENANENFYAAARAGLDADLTWITNDGHETTDPTTIFEDILAHARDGLQTAGCSSSTATRYLRPLRARVESEATPADWKRNEVRSALEDGDDFETAVTRMQRRYFDQQEATLLEGSFEEWL